MEHEGYILIADITGYTAYLNESELEHAKGTLTDLLELLIEHTKPPLVISRLEGDAVFSYGFRDGFKSPQTFLEKIEDTYVAFRRAIELMVLNNTCLCNACANVSSLDLKFFVHFGTFALQRVGDTDELMGTDVNLIHRLVKNSVTEETGIRAYILCTEAAERSLGMPAPSETLVPHTETVPDFGQVEVWVRDMHPVWVERRDEGRIVFSDDEVISTMETTVSLPQEVVWDYLAQSELRNLLAGSDQFEVRDRTEGRIGRGSTYQCYHGKKTIPQTVLEWRPFERILLSVETPLPGKPLYLHSDIGLEPVDGGTRLSITTARPTGPGLKRRVAPLMMRMMEGDARRRLEAFRDAVEADFASNESLGHDTPALSTDLVRAAAESRLRPG